MKMKNEMLEEYIRDNNLQIFKKEYKHDLIVELSDGKSKMEIMQLFNYVSISIDGEFFNLFEKRKTIDGKMNWVIIPKGKLG